MKMNKRYGKWTVIRKGSLPRHVVCKCDCGKEKEVFESSLTTGVSNSCGCLRGKWAITHGLSNTELYRRWRDMLNRCNFKNGISYKHYGARGIKVDPRWNKFENFKQWAMDNGYKEGLSLDRINLDLNYCPENCRWVTRYEQGRNKRNTMWITAFGETKIFSDWARDRRCKANRATLWLRLKRGISPEVAMGSLKVPRKKIRTS